MTKTTIQCDGCRTEKEVLKYKMDCGKEMDPSGNGYNTIWWYRDWCFNCFKNYVLSSPKPIELLGSIYRA